MVRCLLEVSASSQGTRQCYFVDVVQVSAFRDTAGDARYSDAKRLQEARQIERRCVPLDIRVGRKDHLADRGGVLDSRKEFTDAEVFGADSDQWRDRALEDMVNTPELMGFLHCRDVLGLFHDTDQRMVATVRSADRTRIHVREVVANGTRTHLFTGPGNRVCKGQRFLLGSMKEMEGKSLRCLRADPWKTLEFVDEASDWSGAIGQRNSLPTIRVTSVHRAPGRPR